MFGEIKKIHFIGIGGIGMSGIAELLYTMGYQVSGSDLRESGNVERLRGLGIKVWIGHDGKHVGNADVVVYSSAIRMDNPEIIEARKRGIPVIPRAEMLAELMRMKYSIAVAGTHGKTTTTSLIGHILNYGGFDPTIIVGGRLKITGINARLGKGDYLVAEADESDRSFLKLFPTIAVITNIDEEHLDMYVDIEDIKKAFSEFAGRVPFYGSVYLCYDDPNSMDIKGKIDRRIVAYGLSMDADIKAVDIEKKGFNYSFVFQGNGTRFGRVSLKIPGLHNVYNAVVSIGVGIEAGLPFEKIKEAIEGFTGVIRRFELKGKRRGITVYDDYAHHPREILTVLKTARDGWKGRIIAIFQPHLYSRTILLKDRFGSSFRDADVVIVTDIYPSREDPIPGVTGKIIADAIRNYGHREVHYIEKMEEIPDFLKGIVKDGDMVITIGAGNIYRIGEVFLDTI